MIPATGSLIDKIKSDNQELLSRFDPDQCIDYLDCVPKDNSYHNIPDNVRSLWAAVSTEYRELGFESFQNLILLRLIERFEKRNRSNTYPDSIRECFGNSFRRIIESIADPEFILYRTENDILLKDLGLCREKIFPAGARVVAPDSGFHRSLMFRKGISQAYGVIRLLLESGGNTHWYRTHTHLSELDEFNPKGWNDCCLRLADMLALNPGIRGLCGGSWFYDPALEYISPRLTYLRSVPQDNGAYVFYSNIDINGGALSKSDTRKQAYENGEYLPKSYSVIWPRRRLLDWAASVRAMTKTTDSSTDT
jgi:hypothetical protein